MPDDVQPAASGSRGDAGLRRLGKELRHPDRKPAGPTGQAGASPRRGRGSRRLRGRRWPRRTLIAVNVVTLLAIIGVGGAYGYAQWRLGQIKHVAVKNLVKPGHSAQSQNDGSSIPPFTMLVIGSDSRNLGAGGSAAFGSDTSVEGQRSDSIILVRVVPKTKSLAILSIPRDTIEPIPGYGTTRINTAFNTGSPSLLVTVLDQDFGIDVNHVAIFNFDTFRAVADAVGGVEQYFPAPAKDSFSLLSIPAAGCYNLTGDQALAFVRSREYQYYLNGQWNYQLFPESDLARIQRQQSFFKDLVKKAKQVAPTNPFTLNSVISGVTKNLTLDSTFSNSLLLSLAEDFRSANLTTIPSYTYPTVNSTRGPRRPRSRHPARAGGHPAVAERGPARPVRHRPTPSPAVITVNPASVTWRSSTAAASAARPPRRARISPASATSHRVRRRPQLRAADHRDRVRPRLPRRSQAAPEPAVGQLNPRARQLADTDHIQPGARHRPELPRGHRVVPSSGRPGDHHFRRQSCVQRRGHGQPRLVLGLQGRLHPTWLAARPDPANLRGMNQPPPATERRSS